MRLPGPFHKPRRRACGGPGWLGWPGWHGSRLRGDVRGAVEWAREAGGNAYCVVLAAGEPAGAADRLPGGVQRKAVEPL